MIRKNWAHSQNFRDIVELVIDCQRNILALTYCTKKYKMPFTIVCLKVH